MNRNPYFFILLLLFSANLFAQDASSGATEFKVDYESFTLDNGLKVIFHIDRSDPVVAVALTSHVGSAREKEGRTGFAHLFEHMLFQESENVPQDQFFKIISRLQCAIVID